LLELRVHLTMTNDHNEAIEMAAKCVPTNWLSGMLTGPNKVDELPFDETAVERLLLRIRDKILALKRPDARAAWGERYERSFVSVSLTPGKFNTVPLYEHPPAEAALRSALSAFLKKWDELPANGRYKAGRVERWLNGFGEVVANARQALSASPAAQKPVEPGAEEVLKAETERWENDDRTSYPDSEVLNSLYRIAAALTRSPSVERVQDGWKLVPVEPTPGMLAAALQASLGIMNENGINGLSPFKDYPSPTETTRRAYIAMLSASPQPQEWK